MTADAVVLHRLPMLFRSLELKVPPVGVTLGCGAAIWLVARATPQWNFKLGGAWFFAATLAALGVLIAGLGVAAFRRAKTTVNPLAPDAAATLVVAGIYRRTRNPMYLGMLLVLTSLAFLVGNAAAFVALPGFMFYLNRFQITPEERILTARFGEQFTRYRAAVRRWL